MTYFLCLSFASIFSAILVSCSSGESNVVSVPVSMNTTLTDTLVTHKTKLRNTPVNDTLNFIAYPRFDIREVIRQTDTLSIVSGSDLVTHPFGRLTQPQQFMDKYRDFRVIDSLEDPDSIGPTHVYTLKRGKNIIRLFKPESATLEVTSAVIEDKDITLLTGAHTHISQNEFLSIFFKSKILSSNYLASTIALAHVTSGHVQYYVFTDSTLTQIKIASEFTIK